MPYIIICRNSFDQCVAQTAQGTTLADSGVHKGLVDTHIGVSGLARVRGKVSQLLLVGWVSHFNAIKYMRIYAFMQKTSFALSFYNVFVYIRDENKQVEVNTMHAEVRKSDV